MEGIRQTNVSLGMLISLVFFHDMGLWDLGSSLEGESENQLLMCRGLSVLSAASGTNLNKVVPSHRP